MSSSSVRLRSVRAAVVASALLMSLVAGCAGDDTDPGVATADRVPSAAATTAAATTAAARPQDAALRYVRCMRKEGIEMDDPAPDGRFSFPAKAKEDRRFAPAVDKCRELMPPGGGQAPPAALTAEQLTQMRAYAKCMRDNGLADFKDPTAQGFTDEDGPESGTPAFDRAYRTCVHFVQPDADPAAPGVG